MGWGPFDDVAEAFTDTVEWAEDTAEDVGEWVEDTAEDVGDWIEETADDFADDVGEVASDAWDDAQDVYEAAGDAASAVVDPVMESIVSPVGDALLGGLEDSGFFDVVDYASLGIIDMSYGDNGFDLDFGIADVAGFDFQVGNGGFSFQGDYGAQHLGVSWNDNGFDASAALGIDWGPLPYTEGHGGVAPDGNLGAGGEWQGYFPLPGGMVGGHVSGDYQETDDGFRTDWDLTPGVYEPTGEYVGVGTHGSYSESKDGYDFNVGVHAEAGQEGVISARGSFDYNESRHGDVRTQGVSASASVEDELTHTTVEGRIGYQHTETSEGDFDTIFGEGTVRGEGFEVGGSIAGTVGPDGSVRVDGAGHAQGGGYEIAGHGSVRAGPDGLSATGDIDSFETPDGVPDPDGLPTDEFPGLEGLPTDDFPGAPDSESLVRDGLDRAADEGRRYLDDATQDAPTAPDLPAVPDVPNVPDPPAFPDAPAAPESPDGLPF